MASIQGKEGKEGVAIIKNALSPIPDATWRHVNIIAGARPRGPNWVTVRAEREQPDKFVLVTTGFHDAFLRGHLFSEKDQRAKAGVSPGGSGRGIPKYTQPVRRDSTNASSIEYVSSAGARKADICRRECVSPVAQIAQWGG